MKARLIVAVMMLAGFSNQLLVVNAHGSHPGTRWSTNHIKVKLADNETNGFDNIGVSTAAAERMLRRSISFLNTYLGSNAQFEYLGRGCSYADKTDGILCVHAWDCGASSVPGCGTSQGCQSHTAFDAVGRATDGWVRIVGGSGTCGWPSAYSAYPWDVDLNADGRWVRGTDDTLVGLFNHELFHALGGPGHHTTSPQQSRINNGGSENPIQHYPSVWEIQDIARVLYGSQTLDAAYIASIDNGVSWSPGSPAWVGGRLYRFGSVTTGANFLGSVGSWYFNNAVYFKKLDASGIGSQIRIDPTSEGLSWSPASVAYASSDPDLGLPIVHKLLAIWLANESNESIRAEIRYALSFDNGVTWPVKGYITDSDGKRVAITRKTVSTGFDSVSRRFIVLWHNNSDQLSYVTMPFADSTNDSLWYRGTINNYALDGASIACTNRLLDDNGRPTNCLILWTEMHDTYCLTWRQGYFRRSGTVGEFVADDLRTQCKQGWSVPSVTWHPGDQAFPFHMTWMNPNTTIFSMRKPQTRGVFWQDERSFSTAPFFTSPPSIGSWYHTIRDRMELGIMYVRTP